MDVNPTAGGKRADPAESSAALDRVPYPLIWRQLAAGKVVPFLGAGASIQEEAGPHGPPSGSDLSRELADFIRFPSTDDRDRTDLAKVSSYFVDLSDRVTLRELLRERLNHAYTPGRIHRLMARSPRPLLAVVTNYDRLLETAYDEAGVPYDVVVYPSTADQPEHGGSVLWWRSGSTAPEPVEPNRLTLDFSARHVIFKMHGTIERNAPDWDNFVITEEDYTDFLWRMTINAAIPATFVEHFSSCGFLFLGYSLRDWNLRVVLNSLRYYFSASRRGAERKDRSREPLKSWAIQFRPSDLEQRLWDNRGVTIFDQKVDTFAERLWTESRLPPLT